MLCTTFLVQQSFFSKFYYVKKKKKERKKRIIRIFTLISAVAFVGSFGFNTIRMLINPAQSTQVSTQAEDLTQRLQTQARGYETVLRREPENQIALEGLVEIRLQIEDFEGTIEPLETLVRLNPEQKQYKNLLATIKQQVEQERDGKQDDEATSN